MGHRSGKVIMSVVWPYLWLGDMQGGPGGRHGHGHAPLPLPCGSTSWVRLIPFQLVLLFGFLWVRKRTGPDVFQGSSQLSKTSLCGRLSLLCNQHQGLAYWERPLSTVKSTKMKTQFPTHILPPLNTFANPECHQLVTRPNHCREICTQLVKENILPLTNLVNGAVKSYTCWKIVHWCRCK